MVKAGIFLMARLWPVLAGTPEWFVIVTTANHFLADAVLGALTALIAYGGAVLLGRLRPAAWSWRQSGAIRPEPRPVVLPAT